MNILFVNEIPFNPLYGGIERVTDILTKELIKNTSYKVFYLAARIDNKDILTYDFPAPQFVLPYKGEFLNVQNVEYYSEFLINNSIDVVINQRGWAPFMDNVLNIGTVKTISAIHTIPLGAVTHKMRNYWKYEKDFIGIMRFLCKMLITPVFYFYKKKLYTDKLYIHYKDLVLRSSAVVLLSQKDKCDFDRIVSNVEKKCRTYTIANPNVLSQNIIDFKEKSHIILYVGRLSNSEKNPMRLLYIWEKLYSRHLDWTLCFVGDGGAKHEMMDYVVKNKIERVLFEGRSSNVETYYKRASFICLTSDFEGWGMTLTEGMGYGCIPFTFNNYGAAEDIIDDAKNGCLIPPYNLTLYSERLSELMNDENKRRAMAIAAHEKVQNFNVCNIIPKWISLIEEII